MTRRTRSIAIGVAMASALVAGRAEAADAGRAAGRGSSIDAARGFVPTVAPAQAPVRGARGGPAGRGGRLGAPPEGGATPEAAEALFERYVRRQVRVALQLTPAEMRVLEPKFAHLQQTRRRLQRERQRRINELAVATRRGGAGSPEVIRERLDEFQLFEVNAETALREAMAGVEDVLTIEQRARFLVFERQMERRKLELMAQARREAGQ